MQECKTIQLDNKAVFQVGDITIIATANYKENEQSCFDKISDILKEEISRKSL